MSIEEESQKQTRSDLIRDQIRTILTEYTPEYKMKGYSLWERLRDETALAKNKAEDIKDDFSFSLSSVLLEGYDMIIKRNFSEILILI